MWCPHYVWCLHSHFLAILTTTTTHPFPCLLPTTLTTDVPHPSLQLLQQQQAVMAGLAPQSPTAYSPSPGLNMSMGGLLSPTSPTHGASPLSSGSSGTGLASPGLTTTFPPLTSFTNGLPTLSPNGLTPTDPLQSPLHR